MSYDYSQPRIHVPTLRVRLFGEDRLPQLPVDTMYHDVSIPHRTFDRTLNETVVEELFKADVLLKVAEPPRNGRKSSKHRLFIKCGACGGWIPAGRLQQHRPSCIEKATAMLDKAAR